MTKNKPSLLKLLKLVEEISQTPGNEWFKKELSEKNSLSDSPSIVNPKINDIYEFCIRLIIKEHAEKFYSDFKLTSIKSKLIEDFIRMEKFRREDNFEDFCLALFQQIEGIVNELISIEIQSIIKDQQNTETHKVKNKSSGLYESHRLWQLIFYPMLSAPDLEKKLAKPIFEWDFTERYKAVLFIYYFAKRIYNYQSFQDVFFLGNELYQSRNLNHRGGRVTENQQRTIDKVKSSSHKYYFKFLGFLEDFTTAVNKNI